MQREFCSELFVAIFGRTTALRIVLLTTQHKQTLTNIHKNTQIQYIDLLDTLYI